MDEDLLKLAKAENWRQCPRCSRNRARVLVWAFDGHGHYAEAITFQKIRGRYY
jgi:hypothetical protein